MGASRASRQEGSRLTKPAAPLRQSSLLTSLKIPSEDSKSQASDDKAPQTPPAKKASTAKPKTAAPKKAAKPVDKSDLTRVKGIGPATAKKMKEAGITSIEQIANPSDADKQKLEAFKSLKGFSELSAEAKKVL